MGKCFYRTIGLVHTFLTPLQRMCPYSWLNWKRVVLSGIASLKKGNKGPNSTPHGLLSRPREEYQNYHWPFKRVWSKWAIMSARNCRTCVVRGLARLHMYWKSSWRQICQNISCWVVSALWSKSLHWSSRWDQKFPFWNEDYPLKQFTVLLSIVWLDLRVETVPVF